MGGTPLEKVCNFEQTCLEHFGKISGFLVVATFVHTHRSQSRMVRHSKMHLGSFENALSWELPIHPARHLEN
jgi:hypothetical protein